MTLRLVVEGKAKRVPEGHQGPLQSGGLVPLSWSPPCRGNRREHLVPLSRQVLMK